MTYRLANGQTLFREGDYTISVSGITCIVLSEESPDGTYLVMVVRSSNPMRLDFYDDEILGAEFMSGRKTRKGAGWIAETCESAGLTEAQLEQLPEMLLTASLNNI